MIVVASLVSYQIMPANMGGQKGIYLFLKYFSRFHPVVCYTTMNNVPGSQEPFQVKTMLRNNKFRYINLFYFFKLKKEFREDGITHLLLEQPYYGWLALLLKRFLGIKFILHSHNIEALRFRDTNKWWWPILGWYEKQIHKRADFNFFISLEDMNYAVVNFKLDKERCTVITYGTEKANDPGSLAKLSARQEICRQHDIDPGDKLLLFNGTLNYAPNKRGLERILEAINPALLKSKVPAYKIIICGSGLDLEHKNLSGFKDKNIIYPGFVDDIGIYFEAADIFINPVSDGGGIKTKLVEALAAGCSAVSFHHGAIGVPPDVAPDKLKVVADNDIIAFVKELAVLMEADLTPTPPAFYDHFYWRNITAKAATYFS
jgi:glycosyltransferase involved in cell wall biosynthesis